MISFLEIITINLGLEIIALVALVLNLGSFIFMAANFRLGLVMMFITNSMLFLWAYNQGWDYSLVLTLAFLSIGLLSLTLWSNNNFKQGVV